MFVFPLPQPWPHVNRNWGATRGPSEEALADVQRDDNGLEEGDHQ